MDKGLLVALLNNPYHAVEVGVSHGRAGWQTEPAVKQLFGHFSPHHSCSLLAPTFSCLSRLSFFLTELM